MNYYVTSILTAKSSVNNVCCLVLICNENQNEQCGIRKIITPNFPYYKYILDSIHAQNIEIVWGNDICIPYILPHPIFIGEGNIEIKEIPQIHTLNKDTLQQLEYNSVLSVLINGVFEKSWEEDFIEDYNINLYSLKLFGNFTYGNISYNTNTINSSLQQIRSDFDKKYNNYINAPIYKQSEYTIEIRGCDKEDSILIVYPEIKAQKKLKCDYIEEFKWGLAIAQKDGLKGVIDIEGNFIIPCFYSEILPLKLFKRDEETYEEIEIEKYDRYNENSIHTFIQNQDGIWANVSIDTYNDRHWSAHFSDFKYEKLFYFEDKNYMIALICKKYANKTDGIPIEYVNENFDFLYRLALVYYDGSRDSYNGGAIDDIVDVFDNKFIVAKKETFFEDKIGLFKIEENKYSYYTRAYIKPILKMTDNFKTINYIGNNIFAITLYNIYDIEKYYSSFDFMSCSEFDNENSSCEYMILYHLRDGFLNPPNLPTDYTYQKIEDNYLPIFSSNNTDDDFSRCFYYDENSCNWKYWYEFENDDDGMILRI